MTNRLRIWLTQWFTRTANLMIDFAAELANFDEFDESFPYAEKIPVTQAKERFNISDAALKNFIDTYKNLHAVVNE